MKFKDLTGKKFKQLTVIKQFPDHYTSGGNKVHKWLCECDCGRDKNIVCSTNDLTSGKRWRCTYCVRDDAAKRMKNKNKKYNTYDLSGDYGIGYTINTNEEFWFDLEDYDKIKDYCWHKHHKYFIAKIDDKSIGLHKVVMNDLENKYDIDHIKTENKFDNRKLNLRKTTRQQNNSNHKLFKNNTSGVSGVRWHSRDNVWESWIKVNYENIYLGRYTDFDDAVRARKQAEEKYYGEYSYSNSQRLYEKLTKGE